QESRWHSRSACEPARDGIGAPAGDFLRIRAMDPSIAQFTKGERPRPASVVASLLYLGSCPDVRFSYVGRPPPGMPADSCEYVGRPVLIHDARDTSGFLDLDRNGFELWHAPSSVHDFLDEEEVEARYVPELVELVLRATGGATAHVFDTLLRRREFGRPPMTLGGKNGSFAAPAGPGRLGHPAPAP